MSSHDVVIFQMSNSDDNEICENDDDLEQRDTEEKFQETEKVKNTVINRINDIFDADLSNLRKVNGLQCELLDRWNDLAGKLDVANSETPSQLHESLSKGW